MAPPPSSSSKKQTSSPVLLAPWQKGLAGSFGGLAEAVLLQPVDTVKTRLQLDKGGAYKGMIHAGRTIAATEGTAALWKGVTPFATQLFLKYSLRFSSQAFFAGLLRDADGQLSGGRRMFSGLCAGVTEALVIITPLETAKIRLQQQRGLDKAALKYRGPVHAASTILREEGVRGLWSGATPTMLRNGTNQVREGGVREGERRKKRMGERVGAGRRLGRTSHTFLSLSRQATHPTHSRSLTHTLPPPPLSSSPRCASSFSSPWRTASSGARPKAMARP